MSIYSGSPDAPLDLLIVGAGMSGIGLAHHVSENFPEWEYEIHDTHDDLGGTWHLFQYPGIRSDSDMASFSFPFRPWPHKGTLGQGNDIKEYTRDVARDAGALERLHLKSWVKDSDWRTDLNLYRITVVGEAGERIVWARRVHYASGYYSHAKGFRPDFPGEEKFTGEIVHPQHWPSDIGYKDKKFVVIGSGATAITLIPAIANAGAHVTMLQRTPSYIAPLPEVDIISGIWGTLIPNDALAFRMARFNHASRDMAQFVIAQNAPWVFKQALRAMQRIFLPSKTIKEHFNPPYRPWDQRVCKAPNGDIFQSIRDGQADVVTDTIESFTENGILLTSGKEIEADVIVTATGLELESYGGGSLSIDGEKLSIPDQVAFRGMMLAGIPNMSFTVGYVNASWTLRADMVAKYMIKLWKSGHEFYAPEIPAGRANRMLLDFEAGYIKRGGHRFPKQGDGDPWEYIQNYLSEIPNLTFGDQNKAMAFDGDALALAKEEHTTNEVRSVEVAGPYRQVDLSGLPGTRFVDVSGKKIRVQVSEGTGDTVVMIHGIGRSLEDWEDQVAIDGSNRRIIAVDIPGFGLSDPADNVTLKDTAALLWKTIDELGESTVNLIGNSLGGALAMEMTGQQPSRVLSAGLVDSAGFGKGVTPLLKLISIPGLGRLNVETTRLRPMYQLIEHVIMSRPGSVTKHRVKTQGRIAKHKHRSSTFYKFVQLLGTPFGIREEWRADLLERFSATGVPTFVTWGTKDHILPYRDFNNAMAKLSPEAAVVFENCGHMPQSEFPHEFAAEYGQFLQTYVRNNSREGAHV